MTTEEYTWARDEYIKKAVPVKEMARILKVDPEILYDFFSVEGIQRKNKFTYNHDFFEDINNEEKAYWLGFLYADGYLDVPDNKLVVETTYSDVEHLNKLIEQLCPLKEAKKKTIEKFHNVYDIAYVYFNSPQICHDLIRAGCTGQKTFTLQFPTSTIKAELLPHFIRGYFDGDGSVHPIQKRNGIYVEFCGNEQFLIDLQNFLVAVVEDYSIVAQTAKGNAYAFRKGGDSVSRKLYEFMYTNATVYLERKYNEFVNEYGELKQF